MEYFSIVEIQMKTINTLIAKYKTRASFITKLVNIGVFFIL